MAPRKRLSSDYLQRSVYPIVVETMTLPAREAVNAFRAAGMKYTAKQIHRLRTRVRQSTATTPITTPTAAPTAAEEEKVTLPKEGSMAAFVCGLPLDMSSREASVVAKQNGFPTCTRQSVNRIWWYYKGARQKMAGKSLLLPPRRQKTALRPSQQSQPAAAEVAAPSSSVALTTNRSPIQRVPDSREHDRNRLRVMILEIGMKTSREVWDQMVHITNSISTRDSSQH